MDSEAHHFEHISPRIAIVSSYPCLFLNHSAQDEEIKHSLKPNLDKLVWGYWSFCV